MYLLERNRLLTVLADFPTHLLLRVLPVIVLLEPLYLIIALRDGWGHEKVARLGLAASAHQRRERQAPPGTGTVQDAHALDSLLVAAVTQTQLDPPRALTVLNRLLTLYWRVAHPSPQPSA